MNGVNMVIINCVKFVLLYFGLALSVLLMSNSVFAQSDDAEKLAQTFAKICLRTQRGVSSLMTKIEELGGMPEQPLGFVVNGSQTLSYAYRLGELGIVFSQTDNAVKGERTMGCAVLGGPIPAGVLAPFLSALPELGQPAANAMSSVLSISKEWLMRDRNEVINVDLRGSELPGVSHTTISLHARQRLPAVP